MVVREPIVFLDTPRAGGERGHRFIVPFCVQIPSEIELAEHSNKARSNDPSGTITTVSRDVDQVIGGFARKGTELIVVHLADSIPEAKRKDVLSALRSWMEEFEPSKVDWKEGDRGLIVRSTLLDPLYNRIHHILNREEASPIAAQSTTPSGKLASSPKPIAGGFLRPSPKIISFLGLFLLVGILITLFSLLTNNPENSEDSKSKGMVIKDEGNQSARWEKFKILWRGKDGKKKDLEPTDTDAKAFWEMVRNEKWTGGDFRRENLVTDNMVLGPFLDPKTPEDWTVSASTLVISPNLVHELEVLRNIYEKSGKGFVGSAFVSRLNESLKEVNESLKEVEHIGQDPSVRSILVDFQKRINAVQINTEYSWPTPSDAHKTALLRELVFELGKYHEGISMGDDSGDWEIILSEKKMDELRRAVYPAGNLSTNIQSRVLRPLYLWLDPNRTGKGGGN